MSPEIYHLLEVDRSYHATYFSGRCVIKKTAEGIKLGLVQAELPNGKHVERHHAFFTLKSPCS